MTDLIHSTFVENQTCSAVALQAANPDLFEILALPEARFHVLLKCPFLLRLPGGDITRSDGCEVGITFGPNHCRCADLGVATMLTHHVFHPNIRGGAICLGRIAPATQLADILVQIYEMLVWASFTPQDCLNPDAAQWGRNHPDRAPLELGRAIRIPKPGEVNR